MSVYVGRHPVYVSHVKEVESLMYFVIDLQEQLQSIGLDSGEQYDCLGRVRQKCRDLLIKMYAEDSDVMLILSDIPRSITTRYTIKDLRGFILFDLIIRIVFVFQTKRHCNGIKQYRE